MQTFGIVCIKWYSPKQGINACHSVSCHFGLLCRATCLVNSQCNTINLHFMKVSTEIDNNFGYEKITQLVDNIPLTAFNYSQFNLCVKLLIK
jgi:hypothetical protein